jgi:two-component system response regulator YesN
MNHEENNAISSTKQKDFWESLQMDMLTSNQKLSREDYYTLIERSFMFSMFFRGCPPLETSGFQKVLGIKDNGYVILIEFSEQNKPNFLSSEIEEFKLIHFIKSTLKNETCTVGPLITRRISLLISFDSVCSDEIHKERSIALCRKLITALEKEFNLQASIGIGTVQSICSVYSSFIEALTCMNHITPSQAVNYLDMKETDEYTHFDYTETEKHLFEAIRLRKTEAYDYFGLIMTWIRPLNDDAKRNKILEILVMATHTMRMDNQNELKSINYLAYQNEFMGLKGDKLIEFAFQRFIYITSYVKPQSSIDYTNNIVKTTREYLENHYADDISLEDMAEQVNISPQYFSKLIKKTTGFNFIDWLSMLRVKKAKELLTNSNLTVKEVCFMVGYKDPNYFSRIFKKRIGITPSEYIKTSSYFNNKS